MNILDDDMDLAPKKTLESAKRILELKLEKEALSKTLGTGRTILYVIIVLTVITVFGRLAIGTSDPVTLAIVGVYLLFFISTVATEGKMQFYLFISSASLYFLDLVSGLFTLGAIGAIGAVVKGAFLFFMVKAILALKRIMEIDQELEKY